MSKLFRLKVGSKNYSQLSYYQLKSISALMLLSHLSSGCMIVQATISGGATASSGAQSATSATSSNTG